MRGWEVQKKKITSAKTAVVETKLEPLVKIVRGGISIMGTEAMTRLTRGPKSRSFQTSEGAKERLGVLPSERDAASPHKTTSGERELRGVEWQA